MLRTLREYKKYFSDKNRLYSLAFGLIFLTVASIINHYALAYASNRASNSVDDLILSSLPVVDVDLVFIYGGLLLMALIMLVAFELPERPAFVLKSLALFIVIRSIFITFTHLAPAIDHIIIADNPISWFTGGGADLFFSGHTGMPFLIALIFWKQPIIRYPFLVLSILFGIVVLLGHLHYTIDVFAAFFITYGIADLSKFLFAKDYHEFQSVNKEPRKAWEI